MELDMKKEKHSGDKISEQTLHEILLDIKYRLDHIEDMEADNRAFIVKMIKQGNSIVRYLSDLEIQSTSTLIDDMELPSFDEENLTKNSKFESLKELLDEFMDRHQDLKELEKELKKNKEMLTTGQLGEA